ncbi:MAG TPA: MFS transporter [Anaerolineaceae bacterium]|nr:MFS transporter [Anaerolineaceae bacterium]
MNTSTYQSTRTLSFAVLSLSMLAVMAVTALAPALGRIQDSFPHATQLQLQMLLNFPALFIIPFSLLSGQLSLRFKKRHILFAGLIIFSISGVASAFVTSFSVFLVLRAFLGLGLGLVTPLSFSLIADLFTGDTRARLMGWSSAVATLSAIGMSLLSGWLAIYNWRYALGAYGLGILVILMVYFYLPEPDSTSNEPVRQAKLPVLVYAVVLFTMFSIVIFNLISNQMAFYLKSTNLGDSAESGIALASYQGAQFFVALIFDKIYRYFKNNTAIFGLAISVIGFMILFSSNSFWMIVVAVFITGLGIGMLVPFNALTISNQVGSDLSGWALSLNTSALFAGQFISPFLFSVINSLFNFSSIRFYFLSAAVMCAGVALIMVFAKTIRRKQLSN